MYEFKVKSKQNVIHNESAYLIQTTHVFITLPVERFSWIVSRSSGPQLGLQREVLEVVQEEDGVIFEGTHYYGLLIIIHSKQSLCHSFAVIQLLILLAPFDFVQSLTHQSTIPSGIFITLFVFGKFYSILILFFISSLLISLFQHLY